MSKYDVSKQVAAEHGVSYQQSVLAWGWLWENHMFVLPWHASCATILDSMKADSVELSADELDLLNRG